LSTLTDATGDPYFGNISAATDVYSIGINGGASVDIPLHDGTQPISIQGFVDQINANSTISEFVEASYDDETGELSIRPINAEVKSIEVGLSEDVTANFGFGVDDAMTATAGNS